MPEEKKEEETPKPTEKKEPKIMVVKEIPKVEIKEATYGDEEVICETVEEALTAIRNDLRAIKGTLG